MNGRAINARVAANTRELILASGADSSAVANAAGMDIEDLNDRIAPSPAVPFTVGDLIRVGGVLRVPADRFLEGAA